MKILLFAEETQINSLQGHSLMKNEVVSAPDFYDFQERQPALAARLSAFDLIIDLNADRSPEGLWPYRDLRGVPLMVGACLKTLHRQTLENGGRLPAPLFGVNGLPFFVERAAWEVSSLDAENRPLLAELGEKIGFPFHIVEDSVGMVAARTLAQIINEAYLMNQEGSAERAAIDAAMKAGVNYPKGPFEWANKIGENNVLALLTALNEEKPTGQYVAARTLRQS